MGFISTKNKIIHDFQSSISCKSYILLVQLHLFLIDKSLKADTVQLEQVKLLNFIQNEKEKNALQHFHTRGLISGDI